MSVENHVCLDAEDSPPEVWEPAAHLPKHAPEVVASSPSSAALASRPLDCLILGAWFGLVAGLAEMLLTAFRLRLGFANLWHVSSHYIWMMPTASMLFFLLMAAPLAALAWWRPSRHWLPAAALIGGFWFFFAWITLLGVVAGVAVHLWAGLLLALGAAWRATRWFEHRSARLRRPLYVTTGAMALLVGLLAVGSLATAHVAERRALAALPPAAGGSPNVLLIVLDTVRAKSMSLYGFDKATTPNIDRWAGRGVVFDRALSPSPWTLPAHASMFTGKYPHALACSQFAPLEEAPPTLAETFRRHGYLTAGFVGNVRFCGRLTGLARGFDHYDDCRITLSELVYNARVGRWLLDHRPVRRLLGFYDEWGRKRAPEVRKGFLAWLDQRPKDRPYFAFLNYYDVHDPYLPIGRFEGPEPTDEQKEMLWRWRDTCLFEEHPRASDVAKAQEAYHDSLKQLDREIGLLFEELEARGELENTLVVLTADHGEHFGEHGLLFHFNSLYRPLVHVPLAIRLSQGGPASGKRVSETVSLRDLPATILELAGWETGPIPGDSFAPLCGDAAPGGPRPPIFASLETRPDLPSWHRNAKGPVQSVLVDGKHYILEHGTGREELYDFRIDEAEVRNLASETEYHDFTKRCRHLLPPLRPEEK